ncbi:MAG: radical SAM protein [Planctomycetes bacterium]|nr:radical SAM protein [Planctomycetota bacterium]
MVRLALLAHHKVGGAMICEFTLPQTRERVMLIQQERCLVLLVDGRCALAFDAEGRVLCGVRNGVQFKRGMSNNLLRLGERREILPPEEASGELALLYEEVRRVADQAPPAARRALEAVTRCGVRRLEEEARHFKALYGQVPVLPPDQVQALYLQATVGCSTNRCSFCTLYRDRRFRVRTIAEFEQHVRQVLELVGRDVERRTSIFLGDAGALMVPADELAVMMRLARAAVPGRPFSCFASAGLGRRREAHELRELRDLGLDRVTIGLETAHRPLYDSLRKPHELEDAERTVRLLKDAGLHVGLTVLLGVGGQESHSAHVNDTARFLDALPLGPGDWVYLSPLHVEPNTEYAAWARGRPARQFSIEQLQIQKAVLQCRLRASLGERGVRITSYDISRFVY